MSSRIIGKRIIGKCPKCGIKVDTETSPRTWVASASFGLFCTHEHYEEYKRDIGIIPSSEQKPGGMRSANNVFGGVDFSRFPTVDYSEQRVEP